MRKTNHRQKPLVPESGVVRTRKPGASSLVKEGSKRPCSCGTTGGKVFSVRAATMSEGLRSPEWQITRVIARVSYGCPLQAIDGAFLQIERAGKHGEQVPSERIVHNVWDRQPVQADEISVQRSKTVAWMALVIMGPTGRSREPDT